MADHEQRLSVSPWMQCKEGAYGCVVGFSNQAVVVLCIDREYSRALRIEACICGGQGSQEGDGCGRECGVMHLG